MLSSLSFRLLLEERNRKRSSTRTSNELRRNRRDIESTFETETNGTRSALFRAVSPIYSVMDSFFVFLLFGCRLGGKETVAHRRDELLDAAATSMFQSIGFRPLL